MKTKSKYLSYSSLILIIALIVIQVADGFSGILILPLARFVSYWLTINYNVPVILQLVFIAGFIIFITSVFNLFSYGKNTNSFLHLRQLQFFGANTTNIITSDVIDKTIDKIKNFSIKEIKANENPDLEQGVLLVSSGTIMFANKKFFKLTGYSHSEIFGKDFASLIRPESLLNYTMLCRIQPSELSQSSGIEIISKNSKIILAHVSIRQGDGFDMNGVNLFNLKQVDCIEKDSKSSVFFDSIENIDSIQWIWDDKGIIYLNNSCRKYLPFPLGKIIANPGLLLKLVSKDERNKIRMDFQRFNLTGKFNEEICIQQKDGTEKYYRVVISCQPGNMHFPMRYHANAFDITEEKLLILNAKAAAQNAEHANNNKTAFLANMSHEIRSPLNGIIGFSELLADKNLSDEEREKYLNIIQNNGNVLITLLSDLIEISKLEAGQLVIANRKFVPALLMDELKYQFSGPSSGKSDNVRVIFNRNRDFRHLEIQSDPNRLRQILVNLITNAIKFTSKGIIEIGTDFSGNDMLFWVKDTGIGIPYENQNVIFERFRQVDPTSSSPILGFGLGLAISKALVELLGGQLWVESVQEKGSLFTFTIKTNIVNNTMKTDQFTDSSYPYDFRERTILIAEDIDFSFLYIEAVLRRTGVKILWAQNGEEAIKHVKANQSIDLILMDMHMPIMGGYEATELILKLRPGIPIIAQTAFVLPDDVKKCFTAGCSGFLAKPIRKEQLLNTMAEYFDKIDQNSSDGPMLKLGVG